MQLVNTFLLPSSDFGNTIDLLYSLGSWGSYAFEAIPFFMNLGFNKLFRSELFILIGFRQLRVAAAHGTHLGDNYVTKAVAKQASPEGADTENQATYNKTV
jgi:hypothetical protein